MSGDVLLNQDAAISMSLHLPMNGAWSAELAVATEATYAVGDVVTLTVLDTEWSGRVMRAAQYGDRLSVRLTGGATDWGLALGVKHYRNSSADQVIADAGVTLAESINQPLAFWTRAPGTPGSTVQAIARYLGLNWRVQPDGLVRLAAEAPELVEPQAIEISRDPARGLVELAPELGVVLPGTLVGDDAVGDVVYDLTPDGVRCRYYTEARATLRGSLERLVRWVMRDTIYLTTYSAQVIRQAADGTLDLIPDDVRLASAGLQGVPIRHGLPGVTVEVPAGERVLLAFDGGDPSKPYAMLWHEGQVTKVRIGGTEAVALASQVEANLNTLKDAISNAVPVPQDGGVALQAGIVTALVNWPAPMASEVLETR